MRPGHKKAEPAITRIQTDSETFRTKTPGTIEVLLCCGQPETTATLRTSDKDLRAIRETYEDLLDMAALVTLVHKSCQAKSAKSWWPSKKIKTCLRFTAGRVIQRQQPRQRAPPLKNGVCLRDSYHIGWQPISKTA